MNTGETGEPPRVELWVRTLYQSGVEQRQEAVFRRLERLTEREAIDSFEVHMAGEKVGIASAAARTAVGRRALDEFEQFRGWAERNDRSLDRFFEIRTVDSAFTGERYQALSFPAITLAEYVDGELRHVAPHTDGSTSTTVSDRLDRLEGGATPPIAGSDDRQLAAPSAPEEALAIHPTNDD
jgi:hypothetical protein